MVERFNSRLKELLRGSWQGSRGLAKKTTTIHTALIAMSAIAIQALLKQDTKSLRKVNLYRN